MRPSMWSSTSHVSRQHHGQRVSKPHRTSGRCYAGRTSSNISLEESLDILQLDSTALDAAELRQAYYSRMRELHPDVNPGGETTEAAAQVNAAYTALLQEVNNPRSGGIVAAGDVFDRGDAPLTAFFVNPFAIGTDPMQWRELQDAVLQRLLAFQGSGAAADLDVDSVTDLAVEEALLAVGVQTQGGVLTWLTAAQRSAVDELMEEVEQTFEFEVTAWYLADCLLRAERANRRGGRW